MEEWDKWADGHLVINQVLGWETATATGAALIRVNYAGSPDEEKAGGRKLQLAMTKGQVEALIRDLNTTLAAVGPDGTGTPAG